MMTPAEFIAESNRIEHIDRPPTKAEIVEFERFMELEIVTIDELTQFVSVYEPTAVLRDQKDLDVRVGRYTPPRGGPLILDQLLIVLKMAPAYDQHLAYEALHPFTDGNGRSGRMLWAWAMGEEMALSLGFLHRFYYQTLDSKARLLT